MRFAAMMKVWTVDLVLAVLMLAVLFRWIIVIAVLQNILDIEMTGLLFDFSMIFKRIYFTIVCTLFITF